ncbi:VanZ family protein [Streptomyces sp. NRRL B-24484]|uniref:VanZ family protein n=1 Tax=Streptomyces sp. NRRL B-24484 TaxID=1463833 RepID=UPI000997CC44|nr:VanZ family protein [Streptomyces sp. NRRL B-24484]
MDRTASPPSPARRIRRAVLAGLAVLGAAAVAFLAQRPLHQHGGGWHGWLGTINGVVFLTTAGLPLAVLAGWALARRRRAGGTSPGWARRASLAEVGMVYGTLPWVWMILLPGAGAGSAPRRVSLVPLRDLYAVLAGAPLTATVQVVGNLLVFAALGFLAPVRFAALASVPRVLALGAVCSVLVETAQYVLWLDRVSSVDDVLLNAAGAGLAALASRGRWRPAAEPSERPRPAQVPAR